MIEDRGREMDVRREVERFVCARMHALSFEDKVQSRGTKL